MDVSKDFIRLFLISLFFILSSVHGADVCVKRSPCSCVFPNGTGIDLSPSATNPVYTAVDTYKESSEPTTQQLVLSTYYYHPCYDVMMKFNTSTNVNSTCKDAVALCRHTITWNGNATTPDTLKKTGEAYDFMGSSNGTSEIVFADDGSSIKYTSNKPSYTFVNLICAETDDQLYVKDLSEPNEIQLAFFSRNACLRQIESTRSVGSTLLIIFFSFVIFYLVLGVCTKKFLMGATGIEVIPNLMFWTELPNLVKDGWAFALNGFKLPIRGPGPATSPDPNSYDSI